MPPSLHPPHLHFHKLKRRHRPAAMARKGLAAILYKLRDVHRPPSSPSPSTPSAAHYSQRCYPPPPSAWPWPSCRHPRTSSFRGGRPEENAAAAVFRTVNTVYDTSSEHFMRRRSSMDEASGINEPLPLIPGEATVDQTGEAEEKEMQLRETAVVCGVQSERLFFEPAGAEFMTKKVTPCACPLLSDDEEAPAEKFQQAAPTMDKVEDPPAAAATAAPSDKQGEAAAAEAHAAAVKNGAVVVTVESKDPYGDFRSSMSEMVAAHGLRDWEALEELLAWYLKLNAKGVHATIVGAFVDLLVSLQASPMPSPLSLPSPSPSSSCITFEEYSSATFDDEEDKS